MLNYKGKTIIKKRIFISALLVFIGLAYYIFTQVAGIGIPCLFKLVTTFDCPGCGISTASIALIQGDISTAINANLGLFIIAPILVPTLLICWRNWLFGVVNDGKIVNILLIVSIIFLLVWGIYRNIPRIIEIIQ